MLENNFQVETQLNLKVILLTMLALTGIGMAIYFGASHMFQSTDVKGAGGSNCYDISGNSNTGPNRSLMSSLSNGDTLRMSTSFNVHHDCDEMKNTNIVLYLDSGIVEFRKDKSLWLGGSSKVVCVNGGSLSVESNAVGDTSNVSAIYFNNVEKISVVGGSSANSFSSVNGAGGYDNSTGSLLPVKLLSFYCKSIDVGNEILWSTASEMNNRLFEVEKSLDGFGFYTIGSVEGGGTSTAKLDYRFIDQSAKSDYARLYYRLKQIDYDNAFEYSPILSMETLNGDLAVRQVYPNPANDHIRIRNASEGFNLALLNQEGSIVYSEMGVTDLSTIGISGIPNGMYLVNLYNDRTNETHKLVIQH